MGYVVSIAIDVGRSRGEENEKTYENDDSESHVGFLDLESEGN